MDGKKEFFQKSRRGDYCPGEKIVISYPVAKTMFANKILECRNSCLCNILDVQGIHIYSSSRYVCCEIVMLRGENMWNEVNCHAENLRGHKMRLGQEFKERVW